MTKNEPRNLSGMFPVQSVTYVPGRSGAAHARSTAGVGALAAAFGQGPRIEEAEEALATAIAMAPAEFDMFVRRRVAWHPPEDHAHIARGFGKAGWEGRIRLQVPIGTR